MWTSHKASELVVIALLLLLCTNNAAHAYARKQNDSDAQHGPKQPEELEQNSKLEHVFTIRKEWRVKNGTIFKIGNPIAAADHSLLYAICSEAGLPKSMSCDVRLEKVHFADREHSKKRGHKKNCTLELIADADHEITRIVSLDRYTDDTAIIVWWQRRQDSQYEVHKIVVSLVPLSHCNQVKQIDFPVDVEKRVVLSNIAIHSNFFDVIVTNEELCRPVGLTCRISFGAQGQRLSPPAAFVTNFDSLHVLPVDPRSPGNGYYVHGTDVVSWKFRSMHVSSDGKLVRHLMSANGVSDPRQLLRATSNSNGLYGICVIGDRKFHCAQFDANGTVLMNAVVNVSAGVQWIALRNLAEGEALLAMGNCNNHKCRGFKVVRIAEAGKLVQKSIDVPELQLKCYDVPAKFSAEIVIEEANACFYFACEHEHRLEDKSVKRSVKFASKCAQIALFLAKEPPK